MWRLNPIVLLSKGDSQRFLANEDFQKILNIKTCKTEWFGGEIKAAP